MADKRGPNYDQPGGTIIEVVVYENGIPIYNISAGLVGRVGQNLRFRTHDDRSEIVHNDNLSFLELARNLLTRLSNRQ